jgi:hypothetical protein
MSFPYLLKLWIWFSVAATAAGWTLSALGQLHRAGYLVFFGLTAVLLFMLRRALDLLPAQAPGTLHKLKRRWRRPLPLVFVVLAGLIFLGGVMYAPSSYTGIGYRLPRALYWLANEQWFWIHTPDFRMNNRACGIEWLSAFLMSLTSSTRPLFLLNFIPFLLLPGLVFAVCAQLGVQRKVAWRWMWLFPTAYNFLLQAGGTSNDTFPTVYALAMIYFGGRAWTSRHATDLWYCALSAALLAGAKASNLPLLLPATILVFQLLPLLKTRLIGTTIILSIGLLVSFLPTALLNIKYCGDWSGLVLEHEGLAMKNPVVGVWGNALLLGLNNYMPPLFPWAKWWNEHALTILPKAITDPMTANFENGYHWLPELPTEDWAGVGLGLSALLTGAFIVAGLLRNKVSAAPRPMAIPRWVRLGTMIGAWVALLAYGMKSGMVTPQRLIAPYYPLLLPLLLLPAGHAIVIRQLWWRVATTLSILLAALILIIVPDRPLWPAKTILNKVAQQHPDSRQIARALNVYTVYEQRADPLAAVRALLPPEATTVGFLGAEDDTTISMWLPIGQRKVKQFLPTDPPEFIRAQVKYVVISGYLLNEANTTLAAWLEQHGAELLAQTTATLKVANGPQPWYVVRLKD